jgi:WD40 repeat protein
MERHVQENPAYPVSAGRNFFSGGFRLTVFIILLISILSLVPYVQALEPAWNYSLPDGEIGGVAVSPKGDLIAAGAGKVLFFSKNGTLLDKEPFGSDVVMTDDGRYTVSAYSTTVYLFRNSLPSGSTGSPGATKTGEYTVPEQVSSVGVSHDAGIIAGQTVGKHLFTINTKTGIVDGNTKRTDAVLIISPGGRIVGITQDALHYYSYNGALSRTVDLTTNSAPHTLLVATNGNSAVFNDGQAIRRVNANNGTELWKQQVTGFVSALAMTPTGSLIVAGTEAGTIAALDSGGNLSWTYASNTDNRQSSGITCVSVSDKGTIISAGTVDGKILFLNAQGNLTGSSSAREYIRHLAMSADGSVVVAAGDSRLYAFFPGASPPVPTPSLSPGVTLPKTSPAVTTGSTPLPGQATPTAAATGLPTTYSVIRTATQSPPAIPMLLVSLVAAIALFGRKG